MAPAASTAIGCLQVGICRSSRVEAFSRHKDYELGPPGEPSSIPADYSSLLKSDPQAAKHEVLRVREEFVKALADGYVCRAFDRERPHYLFYPS